jgi:hypothetical protein
MNRFKYFISLTPQKSTSNNSLYEASSNGQIQAFQISDLKNVLTDGQIYPSILYV